MRKFKMNNLKLAAASIGDEKICDRFDLHLVQGPETGLIDKIKAVVKLRIETYKTQAREERGTEQVLQMSDGMLQDIGLTVTDRSSLKAGLTSLEELNTRREACRRQLD
jgi:uncharacterized protein YjiS (DUF1127 family)